MNGGDRARIDDRASDPVVGWRVWNLSETDAGPALQPAGSGTDSWPYRRPMQAHCSVPRVLTGQRARHEAPELACRCGIHAGSSLRRIVDRRRPAWLPAPVVGRVSLWGRTIEHEAGWRGRFAYPERLRLACVVCLWIEPGSGAPAAAHRFSGRLYTLCDAHAGGIEVPDGRRSEPTGGDPSTLQARLLGAYAVDLLPVEPLEPLFARPPAPETPAFVPSIRLVHGAAGPTSPPRR